MNKTNESNPWSFLWRSSFSGDMIVFAASCFRLRWCWCQWWRRWSFRWWRCIHLPYIHIRGLHFGRERERKKKQTNKEISTLIMITIYDNMQRTMQLNNGTLNGFVRQHKQKCIRMIFFHSELRMWWLFEQN